MSFSVSEIFCFEFKGVIEVIKVKRILCPTDLSTDSDEALRYAVALTRAYEAKLLLLHCSAESPIEDETIRSKIEMQMDRIFIASLAPHLGPGKGDALNWEGFVRHGVSNIGKAIVQEAVDQKVDLIVMRSRRRPRAAVLLGSTAETVCNDAPCPVLVTHPLEREWVSSSNGEIDLNRVLVAHDFSADSELAMNYGLSLAQEYQSELHLLHVLPPSENGGNKKDGPTSGRPNPHAVTAQKLLQALPDEVHLWCKCVNVVRSGKAHEEILAYAQDHDIDLICTGASSSYWTIEKLLGSNVDRVLRQAPCPVLVCTLVNREKS